MTTSRHPSLLAVADKDRAKHTAPVEHTESHTSNVDIAFWLIVGQEAAERLCRCQSPAGGGLPQFQFRCMGQTTSKTGSLVSANDGSRCIARLETPSQARRRFHSEAQAQPSSDFDRPSIRGRYLRHRGDILRIQQVTLGRIEPEPRCHASRKRIPIRCPILGRVVPYFI